MIERRGSYLLIALLAGLSLLLTACFRDTSEVIRQAPVARQVALADSSGRGSRTYRGAANRYRGNCANRTRSRSVCADSDCADRAADASGSWWGNIKRR